MLGNWVITLKRKEFRTEMIIKKYASAGTMESSDAYVEVEPCNDGISVTVESVVEKQFGENIKVAVVIGPEGGIDKEEINITIENGFMPVTLGKRILRTETAPLVISSNILYELED